MLTTPEKVANIIAFLSILFGEDNWEAFSSILEMHPNYIIEKFERYVESTHIQYAWGLHPILRNECFNRYIDKWKVDIQREHEDQVRSLKELIERI